MRYKKLVLSSVIGISTPIIVASVASCSVNDVEKPTKGGNMRMKMVVGQKYKYKRPTNIQILEIGKDFFMIGDSKDDLFFYGVWWAVKKDVFDNLYDQDTPSKDKKVGQKYTYKGPSIVEVLKIDTLFNNVTLCDSEDKSYEWVESIYSVELTYEMLEREIS